MKSLISSMLLMLSACAISYGQNFEGTLKYSMQVVVSQKLLDMGLDKKSALDKLKKSNMYSDTVEVMYKNGYQKQVMNTVKKVLRFTDPTAIKFMTSKIALISIRLQTLP